MTAPSTSRPATVDAGSRRVVLVALAGNLSIALVKFAAFAFTGSTAILTEGIHSVVDTADQALLLVGQARAARPADSAHPFGHGMETYFWSFIVALMIFLAGGAAAIWEGAEKLLHPNRLEHPGVLLAVIAASAVCEALSFRTAYREFRDVVRGRRIRLWRFLQISKDPNVFATLLEDGAALGGLAIAAVGVCASAYLHQAWADGAASVGIGLLLVTVALFLGNETRSLIAGEAAAEPIVAGVEATLASCGELGSLVRMRTLHLGPHAILVSVAWRFPEGMTRRDVEAAMAEVQRRVRAADDRIGSVLFEPDGLGAAPVD